MPFRPCEHVSIEYIASSIKRKIVKVWCEFGMFIIEISGDVLSRASTIVTLRSARGKIRYSLFV